MPVIVRIGDLDLIHCSPMVRAIGSPTVFVAGQPVSFQGCVNTVHFKPAGRYCRPHAAPITIGSTTVKVHGLGVGRVGDSLTGCTFCAQGFPTVIVGG
jgi:uncharacterized Zn-binding protein involved in type VI secretion